MRDEIDFILRVYVSCSWKKGDLDEERQAVENLIKRDLLMHPVYGRSSEYGVIRDYLRRLEICDICIVILGPRYSPHVENEFKFALNNKIPTFVFVKDCKRDEKLQSAIENVYRSTSSASFKDVTELKRKVKVRIIEFLGRTLQDYREIVQTIKPVAEKYEKNTSEPFPNLTDREYKSILYREEERGGIHDT